MGEIALVFHELSWIVIPLWPKSIWLLYRLSSLIAVILGPMDADTGAVPFVQVSVSFSTLVLGLIATGVVFVPFASTSNEAPVVHGATFIFLSVNTGPCCCISNALFVSVVSTDSWFQLLAVNFSVWENSHDLSGDGRDAELQVEGIEGIRVGEGVFVLVVADGSVTAMSASPSWPIWPCFATAKLMSPVLDTCAEFMLPPLFVPNRALRFFITSCSRFSRFLLSIHSTMEFLTPKDKCLEDDCKFAAHKNCCTIMTTPIVHNLLFTGPL